MSDEPKDAEDLTASFRKLMDRMNTPEARAARWAADDEAAAVRKAEIAAYDADMAVRRRRERIKALPVTPEVREILVSGELRATVALEAVRAALEAPVYMLALGGKAGTGKSIAACWALAELDGKIIRAARLALPLEAEDLDAMCEVPIVVIDDLAQEYDGPSGYGKAQIDAILCSRCDAGRLTIITTNVGLKTLCDRYGERLSSRLTGEHGRFVACVGEDLRKSGGGK